jgi:hypothetical protein
MEPHASLYAPLAHGPKKGWSVLAVVLAWVMTHARDVCPVLLASFPHMACPPVPHANCSLFLLLRRLSSEETVSTRLTHNLSCDWTDEFPRRLL